MTTTTATTTAASVYQQLRGHLTNLKLADAADALPAVLDQAQAEGWTLTQALEHLLRVEVTATDARRLAGRFRFANLPTGQTLDDFDHDAASGIDRSLLEAAYDSGASTWQALTNVVIPLCRPGIIIGSIFVVTIVMGDFITIGVMGGQQIASVGKIINVEMQYLQFPAAAANAVILIITTLMIIYGMTRIVDVRKEL